MAWVLRVAVVGLGVSGSLYALLAAERGLEVHGFDCSRRYGRPCGEAVPSPALVESAYGSSSPVTSWWRLVFDRYVYRFVVDEVRAAALCVDGRARIVEPGYTLGYIVDKRGLVEWLRSRAGEEGARLYYRCVRPGRLEGYNLTAVACGVCAAGRAGRRRAALVLQAYCARSRLLEDLGADAAIVLRPGLTGYVWVWRAGGRYNAGVGELHPTSPDRLARAFEDSGVASGCTGWRASTLHWAAPVNPAEPYGGTAYLGEAAGLVTAMAEGIRPALLSAVALANRDSALGRRLVEAARAGRSMHRVLRLVASSRAVLSRLAARAKIEWAVRPPHPSRWL